MFDFIYDFELGHYDLWWECLPEVRLGHLVEAEPGVWRCCPSVAACARFGLDFMVVKAESKELAAGLWLETCAPDLEGED